MKPGLRARITPSNRRRPPPAPVRRVRRRAGPFVILLYPEGKLTVGGPLQPFKAGAGLIAVEGGTPIVPVKLRINRMSVIDRRRFPSSFRGDVEFVVGAPILFDSDTDAAVATLRLQEAVAAL